MIKLLWGTDPHFKDLNPVSRIDNWAETLLDKFRQIGDLSRKHQVDAVILGGDIFDISTPSLTSHALVQRLIEEFKDIFTCPVYSNVGNHDVKYQQLRFLDQMPLGTLFSSGVFQRCYNEHEASFLDFEDDQVVRIVGVPYHGVRYDYRYFEKIKRRGKEKIICLAHVLASPTGGKMFEGEDIISYKTLPDICPEADVITFGHWHKNQGIQQLPSGQWVVNIGSLSRGSLCEDNIDRIPSVALIKVGKEIEIEEIPLKIKPANEVFDLEKREREEERSAIVSSFIEKLSLMRDKDAKKKSVEERMRRSEIPSEVRVKANEIWQTVLNSKGRVR